MDLIDRNELIKKLTDMHSKHYVNWKAFKNYMGERKVIHNVEMDECKQIIDIIVEQPTVEAKEVVHGEWKIENGILFLGYICSECNCATAFGKTKFCPNCGADMRKKVAE